jgi:CRP/FNR family cyclic AMP-dependent transcriptional regulator
MPVSFPATRVSVKLPRPPRRARRPDAVLDVKRFLDSLGLSTRQRAYHTNEAVFSQGAPANDVMFVEEGGVRLTVVSSSGKQAVVGILGPGDFFGEGCLAGQTICMSTATAIAPSTTLLVIEKKEMARLLRGEHDFSDRFISYMLARNIRVEEDLIDQLFNSSERRLARTLLLLTHYGARGDPQKTIPKMSQETLAETIGTTRSRVNFFMNKFRRLGHIEYDAREIHVNRSLLSVILRD